MLQKILGTGMGLGRKGMGQNVEINNVVSVHVPFRGLRDPKSVLVVVLRSVLCYLENFFKYRSI